MGGAALGQVVVLGGKGKLEEHEPGGGPVRGTPCGLCFCSCLPIPALSSCFVFSNGLRARSVRKRAPFFPTGFWAIGCKFEHNARSLFCGFFFFCN